MTDPTDFLHPSP